MRTVSRVKLLPLGILVASLVVPSAFGQCPPVPEGSLLQSGEIARVTLATRNGNSPAAHLPADVLIPLNLTKKTRVIADAAVLASDASPALARRLTTKVIAGKEVGFPGPVSITVPGAGLASNIVEQGGRFIIVGGSDTFTGQANEQGLFLARFEADGTPDPSFGQGGSTRIILFAQNKMVNNSSPSVALSPNGKIVVARTITDKFPGNLPGRRVAVVRLDPDGSLDPTFGNGGLVYTTIDNHFEALSVAVQRDDRVVVGGQSGHTGNCPCTRLATLIRYQSNGQPDPTFGSFGVARATLVVVGPPPTLSRESSFSSIFVQENGLIVAAGQVQTGTEKLVPSAKMLVAEYLPTGELNPAFGSSGAVALTFDGPYQKFDASSLAFRENGKILAGGSASLYEVSPGQAILVDQAFVFAQLTPGGELDATFGNAGKIVVDVNPLIGVSPSRPLDQLYKVTLATSGEIYAAGIAGGPVGTSDEAIDIVALRSDGSLKQDFGKAGLFSIGTYSPWHMWLAQDALLTSGGRLVVSGTHWPDFHHPDAFVLWAYSVSPKPGQATCP
jgi:uncharacterized delta-60 repeat protein